MAHTATWTKQANLSSCPSSKTPGVFSDGLAQVRNNGRWGYIDTDGKFVIPPAYEAAAPAPGWRGR